MATISRLLSSNVRKIAAVWLAWTAAGVFYVTQDFVPRLYRNEAVPWQHVFIGWMAAMYICAAFTPAILWVGRRWPLESGNRWTRALLHLACAIVFSLVSTTIEAPVLRALGVFPGGQSSLGAAVLFLLAYSFHGGVIRYGAVIVLQAVFRSRESARAREREALVLQLRSAELARQLTAAQLSALKMQLQPHFLFNTLGAIMVLVQQDRRREAETMLARLSDFLRLVVDDVDTQEVPLWREVEFLKLYLAIEQARFQDRLRVRFTVDPRVADAPVPHMILQPVVENAVRHGLGASEDAVVIDVDAAGRDGQVVLTVSDDGPGSPEPAFQRKGVGLANTEHRLRRLYGEDAALVAENTVPRGVRITVTLPYRPSPAGEVPCG